MCGRFTLYSSKDQIKRQYNAQVPMDIEPRYNIGPGQKILALIGDENNAIKTVSVEWGFKPKWGDAKSKLIINARCETVHQKNTFKTAFKERRCVIIANGWYEWLRTDKVKQPYYFSRSDSRLLAFAGILGSKKEGEVQRAIVLTRPAPQRLAFVHPRAPLLLTRQQVGAWISKERFAYVSEQAIQEFEIAIIKYHQVDSQVNSIKYDHKHLISSKLPGSGIKR